MHARDGSVRKKEANWDCRKGPSFSSTLLERIYRSIDDAEGEACGMKKQEQNDDVVQRMMLLDKWMENNKKRNVIVDDIYKTRPRPRPVDALPAVDKTKLHYIDNDPLFFSSGSNSSDSNSSLFSEHESIQLPKTKTRSSCFLPPKPIRTREEKKTKTSAKTEHDDDDGDVPASAKSHALKLYAHLKKMKQPISPGVKLTTFINSILSNNSRKKHSRRATESAAETTKPTCSSASSFTRINYVSVKPSVTACRLTAPSTSTRINSVSLKPSVKLVNVKTDAKPSVPPNRGDLPGPERLRELRRQLNRSSNPKSTTFTTSMSVARVSEDAASDCSEDLFELDHLKLSVVNGGDLPVFETTRINTLPALNLN